jgi:hypothetical protein
MSYPAEPQLVLGTLCSNGEIHEHLADEKRERSEFAHGGGIAAKSAATVATGGALLDVVTMPV